MVLDGCSSCCASSVFKVFPRGRWAYHAAIKCFNTSGHYLQAAQPLTILFSICYHTELLPNVQLNLGLMTCRTHFWTLKPHACSSLFLLLLMHRHACVQESILDGREKASCLLCDGIRTEWGKQTIRLFKVSKVKLMLNQLDSFALQFALDGRLIVIYYISGTSHLVTQP